jgi:hypothetical protein
MHLQFWPGGLQNVPKQQGRFGSIAPEVLQHRPETHLWLLGQVLPHWPQFCSSSHV